MLRLFFILLLQCTAVSARPVSYPEGWTSMTFNNVDRHSLHVHYSPTARYSVGLRSEYWREDDFSLQAIQVNHLLKRWNANKSQANLYLKSGLGVAYSDFEQFDSKTSLAGFIGLAVDWETRRYFASYENRYTEAGSIADHFQQSARIGIAPYIANFGSLHTWLMLDVAHRPEFEEPLIFTPLLRFFKGPALLETGISHLGDATFNFIYRF